jgi:hypothetical protein
MIDEPIPIAPAWRRSVDCLAFLVDLRIAVIVSAET